MSSNIERFEKVFMYTLGISFIAIGVCTIAFAFSVIFITPKQEALGLSSKPGITANQNERVLPNVATTLP